MQVIFGWHLDGHSFPQTTSGNECELGGLIAGPTGLTQRLSILLGVPGRILPQAMRIARYMRALDHLNDGEQFYSTSFLLDPWSTASCLLVQRDQLVTAGWKATAIKNESKKIACLRKLEEYAFPLASPAELIRGIAQKLESKHKSGVTSIHLALPHSLLPKIWSQIFHGLANSGVLIEELNQTPAGHEDTDLQKIQLYLEKGKKSRLKNDGTFCLLEADDEFQLAEATAAWLRASDNEQLAVIRGSPTAMLDACCSKAGLPRLGGHMNSPWRSVLQVLPLMLETCWLPSNPYRTLELISLPGGPVPRWLSHHFVKALRNEPGFGGEKWANAWKDVEADLTSANSLSPETNPENDYVVDHLKDLRFWLEPKRFDPARGMPVSQVTKIIRRIKTWASSKIFTGSDSEMYVHVINSCDELYDALEIIGLENITRIQLNRMIDAVSGEGCKPERWRAQAAPWTVLDHPGQIWSEVPQLLWWGFTSNGLQRPQPFSWTANEQKSLADVGVELEHPSLPFIREAYSWRRALLCVKEELLLCRPRMLHGQPAPIHPVWHELEEFIAQQNSQQVRKCHEVVSVPEWNIGRRISTATKLIQAPILSPIRNWKAPLGKLAGRSPESATSIRELISCPLAWVLKYHAQMFSSVLLTLPDSEQLAGDLAHRLLQQLFEKPLLQSEVADTATSLFDKLVQEVGLPLLQRGRKTERETTKRLLIWAAQGVFKLIEDAQLSVVACELRREVGSENIRVIGDLDLLLEDAGGTKLIVDYKWNNNIHYRIEEIERGQQLQLATYSWLESNHSGEPVYAAYYMLRQRRFLHGADSKYNFGQKLESAPLQEIWEKAEQDYSSIIRILSLGEICATGIPANDDALDSSPSNRLLLEPPCKTCNYTKICGRTLLEHEK